MKFKQFQRVHPTDENRYCFFESDLENDDFVYFHFTKNRHLRSISDEGFRTSKQMHGVGHNKTYFAKNSGGTLANKGWVIEEDSVIIATRFTLDQLESPSVMSTGGDIYILDGLIKPQPLGYIFLEKGFCHSQE